VAGGGESLASLEFVGSSKEGFAKTACRLFQKCRRRRHQRERYPTYVSNVSKKSQINAHKIQNPIHKAKKEKEVPTRTMASVSIAGSNALLIVLLIGLAVNVCESFSVASRRTRIGSSSSLHVQSIAPTQQAAVALELDNVYKQSFDIIDECAASGRPSVQLFDSVRYIDKNSIKLYPDEAAKLELWDRAHGSWRLSLATGGGQYNTFKTIPIFAYAMIDDKCFGNGVGLNANTIILSLLGPHYFNAKRRQMGIGIEEVFLFSKKVTPFVPQFMADGMNLGKTPDDLKGTKSRMPTFTIIGASDRSLIARGGTGGIAIWTRLENDIRPAAYGSIAIGSTS